MCCFLTVNIVIILLGNNFRNKKYVDKDVVVTIGRDNNQLFKSNKYKGAIKNPANFGWMDRLYL